MSTRRLQSLPCKSKEKKKRKKRGNIQRKEKEKRKKKMKKINVDKLIHSTKMSNFSLQFSLHFWEKIFAWGENIQVQPFIFLPLHLTKHTPKSFHFYFLSKVFHPSYFTSKQTHRELRADDKILA